MGWNKSSQRKISKLHTYFAQTIYSLTVTFEMINICLTLLFRYLKAEDLEKTDATYQSTNQKCKMEEEGNQF